MDQSGKTAFIFPGQGSQSVGMGKDLFDNFAAAREVFEEADAALGFSLSGMCFSGTTEELALTENTQPAILTTSVAALRVMESEGRAAPDFVAGHSLGEYSALVAAGAISLTDAVKTVRNRGRYMQEAVPVGVGAMAAILGLDSEIIEEECARAAQGQICSPANINSASQVVIAGNAEAVDRAIDNLKERGAKRAIKLNVSAPFHCQLMYPAQEKLAVDLDQLVYNPLRFPLIQNYNAHPNSDGGKVGEALAAQVCLPVQWLRSVQYMVDNGVDKFIEIGAGKVLSGLVKQINRDVRTANVENLESLKNSELS